MKDLTQPEELMTIEDVCKYLKVSRSWVYHRTCAGEKYIPYFKVGKHLRFKKSDVDRVFLNEVKTQGA